jgi:hypothetical protein
MLQLELYVNGVERPAELFTKAFGLTVREARDGWRFLRSSENYDIMLFDPNVIHEDTTHWPFTDKLDGAGIQIVLCVESAAAKRQIVTELGYSCSELYHPPWGSVEFTFQLQEGYLIRVKQPKAIS